jgi:superoxide dismutase, Fe-Mn family
MYTEKKFNLPELTGLSKESVDAHLGLYAGYVKNFNALNMAQTELSSDFEKNVLTLAEITRRMGFEFDGMRLHEYYFTQWQEGATKLSEGSLQEALVKQFGSFEQWKGLFRAVASMRGPGWAILYYDKETGMFQNAWIEEQHLGHFATLPIILALDVWEHAFITDFGVAGRSKYIEAFFENLNWSVIEGRFEAVK